MFKKKKENLQPSAASGRGVLGEHDESPSERERHVVGIQNPNGDGRRFTSTKRAHRLS